MLCKLRHAGASLVRTLLETETVRDMTSRGDYILSFKRQLSVFVSAGLGNCVLASANPLNPRYS